ncbi:cysteine desulfurase, mitochondrial [Helicocarpus griseus UAMH5409]|uniref:cysteine desulfurase n=1 Tax=Helicocarpus griseus UAMH5409 TaxID=1447875 RepID=A0A2B7XI05_9EURO|nr:cysteine desulfurase, mitochondrial [Helicocarpus griseus UAMH5409]
MPVTPEDKAALQSFLSKEEILEPTSDRYAAETIAWSLYKNPKPQLVLVPKNLYSLASTVRYLYESDLDFAVRSGGNNSAGATDVELSMRAWDFFEFDQENETVVIGPGQTWADVDRKLEQVAPGYTVLSTRVPFIGVGGSLLVGGVSWFSGEHGMGIDPKNLLDAQVVMRDGSMLTRAMDPELIWALRGGGGNFGVVAGFKVKAYRYSQKIHAGMIRYQKPAIKTISQAVSDFSKRCTDPKLSVHVAVAGNAELNADMAKIEPAVSIYIFDANGEEHARSESGFKWAFDIEGAEDMTKEYNSIREVNELYAPLRHAGGKNTLLSTPLVDADDIDPDFVVRMAQWFKGAVKANSALAIGSFVILELMGKGIVASSGGPTMTALPHTTPRHILQLVAGYRPEADCSTQLALEVLEKGAAQIDPTHKPNEYLPSFVHNFHDLEQIYGPNYEHLRRLKTKYDPRGRLNKGAFIPPYPPKDTGLATPSTPFVQFPPHLPLSLSITMSNLAPSVFRQTLRACPRRCASVRPSAPRLAAARRCYASESKPAKAQAGVNVDTAIKAEQKAFIEQTGTRPKDTIVPSTPASGDAMMSPSAGILKQATVMDQGARPIYLDMQATTPTDPRVLDAMLPFLTGLYGNPHSRTHAYGWETEKATEQAREHVAKLIGADAKEIIFTSGATESNNMSIKGVARFFGRSGKKKHIITTQTEHKCVLDSCRHLQDEGFEVTYLPVQNNGLVKLEDLEAAIRPETALVSIMTVNNEIGVIQPIKEIGAICRKKKVFFHTDAAQAVGKIPIDVNEWNVDLLSISGHKIYGPKGIGACFVRRRPRVRLDPIITGGGQERGLRSGTLAPPLVVGIGEACRLAKEEMEYDAKRISALSKRLLNGLLSMEHTSLNGDPDKHYPGCVNVSFAYVEGESLLMALKDIALSSGSACTSASLEPSYVLRALGNSDESAHSSIRFGIGRFTTESEIDYVLKAVKERVTFLRELSPLWELVQEGVDLNTIEWSQH